MRLVGRALQPPTTQHQGCVTTQHCDFKIRKCQRAHLFARVVLFLVTIEHILPTARNAVATDELSFKPLREGGEQRRVPAALLGDTLAAMLYNVEEEDGSV